MCVGFNEFFFHFLHKKKKKKKGKKCVNCVYIVNLLCVRAESLQSFPATVQPHGL